MLSCPVSPPLHASPPEYMGAEQQGAGSVDELKSSFDEAFQPKERLESLFEGLKESLQDKPPFLRDTGLALKFRNYYFNSENDGVADNEAWAQGVALKYTSGLWKERVWAGLSLHTSQKIYGPENRDGTLLLRSHQNSFSTLSTAFIGIRAGGGASIKLYRQEFNLPYVNRRDNRMVPNTFEAYTLVDRESPRFHYIVSHARKVKERESSNFVHMSEAAGFRDTDDGLTMAGFGYRISDRTRVGIISYQSWNFMNTVYAEADRSWEPVSGLGVKLSGQYTKQASIGNELGGNFDTHVWGARLDASVRGAVLTIAHTSTGNDSRIRSPFGGYPGYLSLMVKDFNRAGEDGWLLGLSSDFRRFNLKGLSAYMNLAWGDTPDSGNQASPDQREFDITVDYRFQSRWLKGLWLRGRAAVVDQENKPDAVDVTQYRFIANYEIPIL